MNAPNFKAVASAFREIQQEEAEQSRSITERLRPLNWTYDSGMGSNFRIYWRDKYDVPVAKVEGYPASLRVFNNETRKRTLARVVENTEVIAKLICDCVNTHDPLVEALLEALPELKPGYAKAMVLRALEMAGAGSTVTDEDYAMASEYLGDRAGFDYEERQEQLAETQLRG